MASKIYDISFKPYSGERLGTLERSLYLYWTYLQNIVIHTGKGFTKVAFYFGLSIPLLSGIAQLAFMYLLSSFRKTAEIPYGNMISSSAFALFFTVALTSSFLISSLINSHYPIFMRYRNMEGAMWISLYATIFTIIFFPLFLSLIVMFLGGIILFPDKLTNFSEFMNFMALSSQWFLVSLIVSDIIMTISILFKKSTLSSLAAVSYPIVLGIIISIISEILNVPYTSLKSLQIAAIIFSPNGREWIDFFINIVIYTGLLMVAIMYRRRSLWK